MFTLVATAAVLAQGPLAPVNVRFIGNAGGPYSVSVAGGAPQSAVVNTIYPALLSVMVLDVNSIGVSGVTVTFTAPASGPSGLFNGSSTVVTATTDSTGIATAPALTANGTVGNFAVAATVAGAIRTSLTLSNVPRGWVNITPSQLPPLLPFVSPQFGTQAIAFSPVAPNILYLGTNYNGIFKSQDSGTTWVKINTGANGASLDTGRNWTIAVDPTNANVLYTIAGFGTIQQGIFKSVNGGVDWAQMMPQALAAQTTGDICLIVIDPLNHQHLLVSSHSGWNFGPDAGVLESLDGGQTWIQHAPQGSWGAGHNVFFIGQDDAGNPSSAVWILCTQGHGYWRTTDSGTTWQQVSNETMQHGATGLYRAKTGVLYIGAVGHLLRSTDNGRSWTPVGPQTQDGYYAVIGDGTNLYAQPANTGVATSGSHPYYVSPETDGTVWQPFNEQTFADGPASMVFDAKNKIIYSSNWCAGVWKLVTGG